MPFLPHFPLNLNPIALFGLILLLGLIGGELVRFTRFLPRISGYIIVGFLVGPGGFDLVTPSLLVNARIFVDVALGLILFDLGRHLDFSWLRHDRGLLPMAIAESTLTFIFVFAVLFFFKIPWLPSMLAATIAMATSPAVVMMVANDLSAEGPVTRRAMILTSLNNLFALALFTFLLPLTQSKTSAYFAISAHAVYRLFGSMLLGTFMFAATMMLSLLTGKRKESQFVLFVGAVILSIGLALSLNLSSMLTLFTLGVAARNLDRKHKLMEIDFGWVARLFFILLFVVTGSYLRLQGLWQVTGVVLAFVFAKLLAKMCGVFLFAKVSRLTVKQASAIGLALSPMAGLAIGMFNRLVDFNPDFGYQLMNIITAVIAIFDIVGPIFTQVAFIKTGEAASQRVKN